jgi:hypothetical protein
MNDSDSLMFVVFCLITGIAYLLASIADNKEKCRQFLETQKNKQL